MLKVTRRVSQTKPRVKHDTMIKMRLEEEDTFSFPAKAVHIVAAIQS